MYRQNVNYDFQTFFQSQENLSKWQKFRKRCRTLFKDKSNEANVHHPTIKKHQKRLTSGAATGISSAVMEATGTLMASGIKMSHSIYMLSIQNDTKSLKLILEFNNIKFSCFESYIKESFP